jgi:hypothetical protein
MPSRLIRNLLFRAGGYGLFRQTREIIYKCSRNQGISLYSWRFLLSGCRDADYFENKYSFVSAHFCHTSTYFTLHDDRDYGRSFLRVCLGVYFHIPERAMRLSHRILRSSRTSASSFNRLCFISTTLQCWQRWNQGDDPSEQPKPTANHCVRKTSFEPSWLLERWT